MSAKGTTRAEPARHKVREKLHAAAARIFARKGYAASTVQEIVREAGVTKPALYYYFGSKEGVYRAILEEGLRDFDSRLGGIEKMKGSASLRLRRLCREVYLLGCERLDAVRLLHAILYGPPQGAPSFDFNRVLFPLHEAVRSVVLEGVAAGEFRGDAEAMTLALLGACNECIDLELVSPEMAVDEDGFGRVIDLVIRGMKRKAGRS